jgi:hypothetical protein
MANRIFPDEPDPGDRDEQMLPSFRLGARPLWYVINEDHEIRPARDIVEADECLKNPYLRQVGEDHIGHHWVSTVFLCLDHNYTGEGPPVLFETLVQGLGNSGGVIRRYRTWDEAAAGHQEVLEELRNWIKNQ